MKMNKEVVIVRLSDIIPNRFQPRLTFDEEALNELSDSIKEHGIIQPLILRDLGNKYEIIAGERRYKAATLAGLTEVPAIVGTMDDQTSAELALVENIQRKDLSSIEEAKSYKKILEMGNFTQEELAKRMGKSQSTIANKMRLLSLTNEVQVALMNNLISERHARCLLQIKDEEKQKEVLNKIINERMNVRATDEYIKSLIEIPSVAPTNVQQEEITTEPSLAEVQIESNPSILSEMESNNTFKNDNPNVYTQSKESDIIDISSLNANEETSDEKQLEDSNEILEENINPVVEVSLENSNVNESTNNNIMEVSSNNLNETNDLPKIKFATAIKLTKDTIEKMQDFGYVAKIEESSSPDGYQIIIKIEE